MQPHESMYDYKNLPNQNVLPFSQASFKSLNYTLNHNTCLDDSSQTKYRSVI